MEEGVQVSFTKNSGKSGGAVCCDETVYCDNHSHVIFTDSLSVLFSKNNASEEDGGAIYSQNCHIKFDSNNEVQFDDNLAKRSGGAIHSKSTFVLFNSNALTTFCHNKALYGGAIYLYNEECNGKFSEQFNLQKTHAEPEHQYEGYARHLLPAHDYILSLDNGCKNILRFEGGSITSIIFDSNHATNKGGAILIQGTYCMFKGSVMVTFKNCLSQLGGAIHCCSTAFVFFEGRSKVNFTNNNAFLLGGALYASWLSGITMTGSSTLAFHSNIAGTNGGAIWSGNYSAVMFIENSTVNFVANIAKSNGGSLFTDISYSIFMNTTEVSFNFSISQDGGALYSINTSAVIFTDDSTTTFSNNKASKNGGALYAYDNCTVALKNNSRVSFVSNIAATDGGAAYFDAKANVILNEATMSTFIGNSANNGGAVFTSNSNITCTNNSRVNFKNNTASLHGGAMSFGQHYSAKFMNKSKVTCSDNTADSNGGAFYAKVTRNNLINIENDNVYFHNNHARVNGDSVYINVFSGCNKTCLNISVIVATTEASQNHFINHIMSPPNKLVLKHPAHCIGSDQEGNCVAYYISNIMLGQDIAIDGCVLDYYGQVGNVEQFIISADTNKNYHINGSQRILFSCNVVHEVSVLGAKAETNFNYSMFLKLYNIQKVDWKVFSISLIVEVTPCQPGFSYDNKTQKCICFTANSIIECSGGHSNIKRGYWFGIVTGKPTVTICPINYCTFTCCDATNGFFHLSPQRLDQCRKHRSGTACGSCEEGYTLSFDSVECVNVDNCTTGQTVLVVSLTVLYWMVVVVAVFAMMYYKLGIGYFYSVTYYYSLLDILLNETFHLSDGLYTTVSIMSSMVKLTPQFLGRLCFAKDISRIDQHFIHYIHPMVVSLMLIAMWQFTKKSHRFSLFVSKNIIHFICFLLLLSYTSVAITSLLLMRSLDFYEVDKVYTYLSPDIEYFHGRHLPYAIVAIFCTLVIVIGLPLLLLLEPFLNCKINFIRIKPLLDQFQGCYKDKYRCFASYYMICRLVIIIITITTSPDNFTSRYILITASTTIALVHLTVRPYSSKHLNTFDGFILNLMVLVTVIPIFEYFNNFSIDLVLTLSFILIFLPIIVTALLGVTKNKEKFTKLFQSWLHFGILHFTFHNKNVEVSKGDVSITIDDQLRNNVKVTVCAIDSGQHKSSDDVHYRDSFMEEMED
ncbi:uncharacterized protein [Dysidea avara]|uniref:uncharacterized protein n=1 Tax=Dysidea avara TaxID=196820 RepID=UPI003317B7D2